MGFDFDLVDLRLLVNIGDTLSLTRGAERTFMSAPAASARLKKMEEGLGTQLFYRTMQGLVPTSSGHIALRHAVAILQQTDALKSELGEKAEGMKGNIRLFANTLSISEHVSPALRTFLLRFPGVNIDFQEMGSSDIARALKQGAADVGVLALDQPDSGLDLLPYRQERLVVITAGAHPLASAHALDFVQIREADCVGLKEGVALQAFVARAAAREGFSMKLRIQANDFESLCNLVQSGIGLAVVPESVARRHAQHLAIAVLPLRDEWAVRNLAIAVRDKQALTAPARALIDVLTEPPGPLHE